MTAGSVRVIFKDPFPSLFTRSSTSMPESRTRPSKLSHANCLITLSLLEVLEQDIISHATSGQTKINKILGFMFVSSLLAPPSRPRLHSFARGRGAILFATGRPRTRPVAHRFRSPGDRGP